MKVAIFSDTHLGFGLGTKRSNESFENAKSAIQLCIEEKPDLILIPGDIFDSDIPTQETWHHTFPLFNLIKQQKNNSEITLKKVTSETEETFSPTHVPVIAIHGTHEYRGKNFKNALQVLEAAGFLLCIHANYVEVKRETKLWWCMVWEEYQKKKH